MALLAPRPTRVGLSPPPSRRPQLQLALAGAQQTASALALSLEQTQDELEDSRKRAREQLAAAEQQWEARIREEVSAGPCPR